MKRLILLGILFCSTLSCNIISPPTIIKDTATSITTFSPQPSITYTLSPSTTHTFTKTYQLTATRTIIKSSTYKPTETITPTSTDVRTIAVGIMDANCRWGPNKAYLPSGIPLKEGDEVLVEGWNATNDGKWYWIQIEDVSWHCWVHTSTVELTFDPALLPYVVSKIPTNDSVPEPKNINAVKNNNTVTITWSPAPSAPELGYLIEAGVCYDGYMVNAAFDTLNTSYSLQDDTNCSSASFGTLRVKNKLGYSDPITIPWP